MSSLSRNRSSVPPGEYTRNYLSLKELLSLSRCPDTTCAPLLFRPPRQSTHCFFVVETKMCGAQMPMSSDRSVGSRWLRRPNRLLGYMRTCVVPNAAAGMFNTDPDSHSSTFSGGVRACIGWRFACVNQFVYSPKATEDRPFDSVIEIQAFLVTLVRRFDISHTDKQPHIRRAGSGMMIPLVPGEEDKGPQLPLKITAIGNE